MEYTYLINDMKLLRDNLINHIRQAQLKLQQDKATIQDQIKIKETLNEAKANYLTHLAIQSTARTTHRTIKRSIKRELEELNKTNKEMLEKLEKVQIDVDLYNSQKFTKTLTRRWIAISIVVLIVLVCFTLNGIKLH